MINSFDFSNKTALVVGGSSGIGNAIAQQLRQSGAEVYVWGTRPEGKDYQGVEGSNLEGLHYRSMDVADSAAIAAWLPEFERLDLLVLSQGTVLYKQQEFEMSGWLKVMDVNLNSLMACAGKCHPMLAESLGSLIIISSVAGLHANRGNPAYCASKTGAIGLTKTLGEAWAKDGIRVNGVAPGLVDTKLTKVTTENPEVRERAIKKIPMRRFGDPEEIANAALFLASPLASYICGHTLVVDGGYTLS